MTTSDISEQVKQIYGVEVSEGTISNVTSRILEHVKEWQNRPLESLYYVVWMDGIMLKIKHSGHYQNKCIYSSPPISKCFSPIEGAEDLSVKL